VGWRDNKEVKKTDKPWGDTVIATLLVCQKNYRNPLIGGKKPVYYCMYRSALEPDEKPDPTVDPNCTVVSTKSSKEDLVMDVVWVCAHQDIRLTPHGGVFTILVEGGPRAVVDAVDIAIGRYHVKGTSFMAVGSKNIRPAFTGSAENPTARFVLHVGGLTPETALIPQAIKSGERLAFRTRLWAHRVAGRVPVFIALWHRRGFADTFTNVFLKKARVTSVIGKNRHMEG